MELEILWIVAAEMAALCAALKRLWPKKLLYVYVKWSRYRPDVTQRVGRGIALLFHDRGTRSCWVVSSTPRPHFTPGRDPVPILQEAGWAPGPAWTGGKSRPYRDSIPDRRARSSVAIPTELPDPFFCIYTALNPTIARSTTVNHMSLYDVPARCASYDAHLATAPQYNMICCHSTSSANTNWIVNTVI